MKKIILLISSFLLSFGVHAQQNILIYAGPGAGPQSLSNTLAMVKSLVADKYTIKTVSYEEIIAGEWIKDTALLIMPGGADRPYLAKLKGAGNDNIRKYVQNGGQMLGICAGAYYSSDRLEFDKNGPLEVTGERELKFFPDLVEGPTYLGFDYNDVQNVKGMRAAKIYWQNDPAFSPQHEFFVFYNGGGHFVNAERHSNVLILARYSSEIPDKPLQQPAAIVECKVGRGKAILSGPHFEWEPDSITTEPEEMLAIKNTLTAQNANRIILAKHLFTRLGIDLKNP